MLSLTTKYAIRALMTLAREKSDDYMSVETLAEKADVPRPYLSKLMKALASKGMVITKKGLTGGVKLNREESTPTLFDVCVALEDPIAKDECLLSKNKCNSRSPCQMHQAWGAVRGQIVEFLKNAEIES